MFFRQYELACLSLFSYLIGDTITGRAVVVDPQRDISGYLADAEANALRIERVIETHVHADFLSGHLELAAATGAAISYGSRAQVGFPIEPLAPGELLSLGDVTLEIRHTPGHTPEGISIVVREHPDGPPALVLTGDTLFVGDVGRPDLLAGAGLAPADMARDLYESLHGQLLTLPDSTLVYPAHGAGSACGKRLSAAISSTIGEQRSSNYALAAMSIDEFVDLVTAGQPATPPYFAHAAATNRSAHDLLDERASVSPLDVPAAVEAHAQGAALLDIRSVEAFANAHLSGSINVGIDGRFAEYTGDVIAAGQPIVLIGDSLHAVAEARVRLARIGYDTVVGAVTDLDAGLVAHPEHAAAARRLTASELAAWTDTDRADLQILDVRNAGETSVGRTIAGAVIVPLPQLLARLDEFDSAKPTVVYCAGGYRSSIAASTLRSRGFATVADIIGGYQAWLVVTAGRRRTR